jgi:hypothetical protein
MADVMQANFWARILYTEGILQRNPLVGMQFGCKIITATGGVLLFLACTTLLSVFEDKLGIVLSF